ncbi:hypothetical protein MXB_2352, partial [Myxobolus squamalis]
YDKAIVISTQFLEQELCEVSLFHSRAVAYLEKSIESLSLNETIECLNFAKVDILKAIELDDNDHEIYFYASLIFAFLDEIDTALQYYYGPETALLTVKGALELWNKDFDTKSNITDPQVSHDVPIKFASFSRFNKDRYRGLTIFEERFKPSKINPKILLLSPHDKLAEISLALYDTEGLREAEKCKECLETALYLEPNHADSLYHLVLFFLEKYEKDKSQNKTDEDAPLRQFIILAEENARRLVKL